MDLKVELSWMNQRQNLSIGIKPNEGKMRNRETIGFQLEPSRPDLQPPKVDILPVGGRLIGVIQLGGDLHREGWCCYLARTREFVVFDHDGRQWPLPRSDVEEAIQAFGVTGAVDDAGREHQSSLRRRLRHWQQEKPLTDHAAADLFGLSERTYQRWRDEKCQYPKLLSLGFDALQDAARLDWVDDLSGESRQLELCQRLRRWQREENLRDRSAGELLGLTKRTYQRWRDERCQYPRLLRLAMFTTGISSE